MTWNDVAAIAGIAQAIGTLGAFYLTIMLLRQTGRGVETALRDYTARLAPHVSISGKMETGFGLKGPRITLAATNEGVGPAIDVRLMSRAMTTPPTVVSADICVTRSGGAAILPTRGVAAWAASGQTNDTAELDLVVACRDVEGRDWSFRYLLELPEHNGPIGVTLESINRPGSNVAGSQTSTGG